MSNAADEHIRVTEDVKAALERRKRENESFSDVIERLLADERDLMAGFGRWSDEDAARVLEAREKRKQKSKARMEKLAEDDG